MNTNIEKDNDKAYIICEISNNPDIAKEQFNKLIELVDSIYSQEPIQR